MVYSYTPEVDENLHIDLCGSGYDTKVYVMDGDQIIIACNDDYYFSDPECGNFVSRIEEVAVTAGTEYFIVIDGYGPNAGDYILFVEAIEEVPGSYVVDCDETSYTVVENEPSLKPGYLDLYNGGCNDNNVMEYYTYLWGASDGGLMDFCGVSGWTDPGTRDTDWFWSEVGIDGLCTVTLDAEQETYVCLLGPHDCETVEAVETVVAGPNEPATLELELEYHTVLWLWVAPVSYDPPSGFLGHEYDYTLHILGLYNPLPVESSSFDYFKSLYR